MAATSDEWADKVKRYLKAELKRANVGYEELARKLTEMGLPETKASITMKMNRGTFPAWFFFAVLKAVGCSTVRVEDI